MISKILSGSVVTLIIICSFLAYQLRNAAMVAGRQTEQISELVSKRNEQQQLLVRLQEQAKELEKVAQKREHETNGIRAQLLTVNQDLRRMRNASADKCINAIVPDGVTNLLRRNSTEGSGT